VQISEQFRRVRIQGELTSNKMVLHNTITRKCQKNAKKRMEAKNHAIP
jgi:hypothetical protein